MMRGKHSEAIQKLKSQFLREKRSYQRESDDKIQEMAQQASQVREPQQDCHSYFKRIFFPLLFTSRLVLSDGEFNVVLTDLIKSDPPKMEQNLVKNQHPL